MSDILVVCIFATMNTFVINNFVAKYLHTHVLISQDKVLELEGQSVCTVLRILVLMGKLPSRKSMLIDGQPAASDSWAFLLWLLSPSFSLLLRWNCSSWTFVSERYATFFSPFCHQISLCWIAHRTAEEERSKPSFICTPSSPGEAAAVPAN